MKKRKLLGLLCAVGLAFTTASCTFGEDPDDVVDVEKEIKDVYSTYVENGGALSYEEWLAQIKGEKGDKGDTGAKGDKGDTGATGNGIESIEKIATEGLKDTYLIKFTDGTTTTFEITNGKDADAVTNGTNGLSAYEIYKKYHPEYTGTEEEWINSYVGSGNVQEEVKPSNGAYYLEKLNMYLIATNDYIYFIDISEGATLTQNDFKNILKLYYEVNVDDENYANAYYGYTLNTTKKYADVCRYKYEKLTSEYLNAWDSLIYYSKNVLIYNEEIFRMVNSFASYDETTVCNKVTFKVEGQDDVITYVSNNSLIYAAPEAVIDGHSFKSWAYTDDEGNEVLVDLSKTTFTDDVELHAVWKTELEASLDDGLDLNISYANRYSVFDYYATWGTIAEKLGTTFRRATDSYSYSGNNVDLYMSDKSTLSTKGAAGESVNLLDYIDIMPNFKNWIDSHSTLADSLKGSDGGLYYAPYTSYDTVKRSFIMDTTMVKQVLDAADFTTFDTTTSGTGAATNTLQATKYTPYVDENYNYPANTTVKASKNGALVNVNITKTTNIIKQQNELLASGATGKELAEQFRAYLNSAFEGQIGEGKTFESYSDIFISEQASYNADELIALMRVIKANPGVITGDSSKEVELILPRENSSNRINYLLSFMQIWGVQGLSSNTDRFYFGADGKLHDAATTKQTYDALNYLSALYDEGLILEKCYDSSSSSNLNKYFSKTTSDYGYGFMTYDFPTGTCYSNDVVDGIGTNPSRRINTGSSVTGIRPVLPPLTYWATESGFNPSTQELTNKTGKTLCRYIEDRQGQPSYGLCIPSSSDNKYAAALLIDYLYSTEGSRIASMGPDNGEYWELQTINGVERAVFTTQFMRAFAGSGSDIYTYLRSKVGASICTGVIPDDLNLQATNAYGRVGYYNLLNAISTGAVIMSKDSKSSNGYTWNSSVNMHTPTISETDSSTYDSITSFWTTTVSSDTSYGWIKYVVSPYGSVTSTTAINSYTYGDVLTEFAARNKTYLKRCALVFGASVVPDYIED